jgi:hypothetical protein
VLCRPSTPSREYLSEQGARDTGDLDGVVRRGREAAFSSLEASIFGVGTSPLPSLRAHDRIVDYIVALFTSMRPYEDGSRSH